MRAATENGTNLMMIKSRRFLSKNYLMNVLEVLKYVNLNAKNGTHRR